MNSWRIVVGDALERLRDLDAGSVQTCVTSPPYFGLRDYGTGAWEGGDEGCDHLVREDARIESSTLGGGKATTGHQREGFKDSCPRCGATRTDSQLGLEATPDEYVARLVEVFREVRRVLRDDGTLWLNLGDSYAQAKGHGHWESRDGKGDENGQKVTQRWRDVDASDFGVKPKDLLGIPWMVAFALRADGWYLRSDIVWAKPNPMPESVTDRPTKAHEYVFLLSKSPRYFYDADAIREDALQPEGDPQLTGTQAAAHGGDQRRINGGSLAHSTLGTNQGAAGRNKRSVWTVATAPFPGAHFAVFPPKLIEPCVLAGSAEGTTVLDPFAGAGTTGLVATRLGRSFIGIELNLEYAEMARDRIRDDAPLMNYLIEAEA